VHLPEAHKVFVRIAEAWGTGNQYTVLSDVYLKLPKISIDYAIMEPASQHKGKAQVVTVEMKVQWLDIGSWPALAETLTTDDHDNAVQCETCVLVDSDNNVIVSDDTGHLISTLGLSDTIIIHTKDATMVCPRSEAQRVKDLVGKVKEKFKDKYQ